MIGHQNHLNNARWNKYFMCRGDEFTTFWSSYLNSANKDILFVLGRGFDPRMCIGVEKLINCGGSGKRDCLLLVYDEGPNSPSHDYDAEVHTNISKLQQIMNGKGTINEHSIRMWSDDDIRIGDKNASIIFKDFSKYSSYDDVIVDISALPSGIYFPLIGSLLYSIEKQPKELIPNLHVIVSESLEIDRNIRAEGLDDQATLLHGFKGGVDREATSDIPRIWIPMLGEDQSGQLKLIENLIFPDEICPLLPFPSKDPRRGDNLILEYRDQLMDALGIEPDNIIYASETNPFEVYQELNKTIKHYDDALLSLGGCKIVVSILSSKLLSMGALLAAYECRDHVGIAQVGARGYEVCNYPLNQLGNLPIELFELWLAGDCYEG